MPQADRDLWAFGTDLLFARVARRFGRVEPRRQARAYVNGLLAPIARKNGWQLAEAAGQATPDRMQRLLRAAAWDADELRDDLRAYVMEHLGHAGGVLSIGETGFVKKGERSAGVATQPVGATRTVAHCQLGIFAAYASPEGQALVDRELYLPRSWTADPPRCAVAGVPTDLAGRSRQHLASAMVGRALDAGAPVGWIASRSTYGQDAGFRAYLHRRRVGYVVAVPRSQPIALGPRSLRVDTVARQAPDAAWKRRRVPDGGGRTRLYDWATARLAGGGDDPTRFRWLLVRRDVLDPADFGFHLCAGPADTTPAALVRVAAAAHVVHDCVADARERAGLDDYQVRRFDGWYRHVTLAMLAHAFLSVGVAAGQRAASIRRARVPMSTPVTWYT